MMTFQWYRSLAGAEGFEPPHGGTKTHCLTAWRRPNKIKNRMFRQGGMPYLRDTREQLSHYTKRPLKLKLFPVFHPFGSLCLDLFHHIVKGFF